MSSMGGGVSSAGSHRACCLQPALCPSHAEGRPGGGGGERRAAGDRTRGGRQEGRGREATSKAGAHTKRSRQKKGHVGGQSREGRQYKYTGAGSPGAASQGQGPAGGDAPTAVAAAARLLLLLLSWPVDAHHNCVVTLIRLQGDLREGCKGGTAG